MPPFEDLKVFTGNAHPTLARDICAYLGIRLGQCDVFKFSNDNTFVKILENVRERDVYLVQPLSKPVNDHLMELLLMIDAAKRASAGRITAVSPTTMAGPTRRISRGSRSRPAWWPTDHRGGGEPRPYGRTPGRSRASSASRSTSGSRSRPAWWPT